MALTVIKPSGLDLSGNFTVTSINATSNVSAGNLKTDNLLYANGSPYVFGSGTPGGLNTQVQFNDANSFAGSANLTFDKTTNTLSVTNIIANGSGLTSLTGANVTGEVSFAATANSVAGGNVSGQVGNALVAGTVYTNAQPNITSVGTLTDLNVSGNANLGNLATANFFSGNGASLSSLTGSNVTGTVANATYAVTAGSANGVSGANVTGEVSYAAIANSVAVANVTGIGNIATVNLNGNGSQVLAGNGAWIAQSGGGGGASISNGTSNVNISTSGGNITTSVNGNSNIVIVTDTGSNINGYLSVTGVSNLGNVGNVKITGGSSGLFLTTDGVGNLNWAAASVTELANGTSNIKIPAANGNVTFSVNGISNLLTISSTSVTVGNGVGGTISDLDLLVANYVQGTLNANSSAQPNITSVGSLVSLVVTGNLTANTGIATFGSNANVKITGGTSGHFLRTDGTGNLTWATGTIPVVVDNSTNATYFPVLSTVTTGVVTSATIANSKLQFNPSSGQLTVTDLNTTSDMTLKTDVQKIEDPMTILRQLVGFGFNWKDNGKKSYGLMAQLLEKVLPELVSHNAQGLKTVNYLPLIAFLIEAVKTQQDDIEELKYNQSIRK